MAIYGCFWGSRSEKLRDLMWSEEPRHALDSLVKFGTRQNGDLNEKDYDSQS